MRSACLAHSGLGAFWSRAGGGGESACSTCLQRWEEDRAVEAAYRVLGQTQAPAPIIRQMKMPVPLADSGFICIKEKTWLFRKSFCSLLIFSQGYSWSASIGSQSFCPLGESGGPPILCCLKFSLHRLRMAVLFLSRNTNGFFTPCLLCFSIGDCSVLTVSFSPRLIKCILCITGRSQIQFTFVSAVADTLLVCSTPDMDEMWILGVYW